MMTALALMGWALLVAPASEPAPIRTLAVVIHDAHRGITAGLELSDADAVDDSDFERREGALFIRLQGALGDVRSSNDVNVAGLLGHAQGSEAAVARLLTQAVDWQRPTQSVGVLAAPDGVGVFEGLRCDECRGQARLRTAVATVGLSAEVVDVVAPSLEPVHGDPLELLIDLAARSPEFWGDPRGPRSAMLVVVGSDAAVEVIAVDRHGAVGRRLVERHIRHLADVELPHRIAAAQAATDAGDPEGFTHHRRLALRAADQALDALPADAALARLRAAAVALRGPPVP